MSQQIVNTGTVPNDGTGDQLHTAFNKINDNFTEVYAKGATEGLWNYNKTDTNTSTAPVSGRFKTNSGNYLDATQIAIHATTIQAIDRANTLRTMLIGDIIQCQDSLNGAAWCRYVLQSAPIDNGTWFQLNVALEADGGVASGDNQEVVFTFTANTAGGTGTTTLSAPQGRLTLQTATPVMTTTQAAKTTIYYTPYVGNMVPIYDGTSMVMTDIGGELSVETTDTAKNPAAIGVSKVNDWFVWDDAGTKRLSHGPDWTSDTTRSAGTALVRVNGILLNNAVITNGPAAQRGTYVGTTRSNASAQFDWIYGSTQVVPIAGFFGVWNAYNRRLVNSLVSDTTNSWTYAAITTLRPANAQTATRHSFVSGLAEDAFEAQYTVLASSSDSTGSLVGIGYNSTTIMFGIKVPAFSTLPVPAIGIYSLATEGFRFFQAMEGNINSSNTATFYGDNGMVGSIQSGLTFKGWM